MKITAFASAVAAIAMIASPVLAKDTKIKTVAQATAISQNQNVNQNNNRSSVNVERSAPGFGVGGGNCSDAVSLSLIGGGGGFSFMNGVCKDEIKVGIVGRSLGSAAQAEFTCGLSYARNLSACRALNARVAQTTRASVRPSQSNVGYATAPARKGPPTVAEWLASR